MRVSRRQAAVAAGRLRGWISLDRAIHGLVPGRMPISEADLWIAATVRTAGGTLVTNNTREFSRVQNLLLEDWTLP